MERLVPTTEQELAEALACCAKAGRRIRLGGRFTKDRMAGLVADSDVTISTAGLNRVLQYEPRDLTISVQAGLPFGELCRVLAEHRQMVPLDPPLLEEATVGGVVASNCSGPRRRLYGTARDMVIGMRFATLDGKLADSGGMVVKNVAGLDMSKLMIGSFGTLAAIARVNFKLVPMPACSRSFLAAFDALEEAVAMRDRVLGSVLQPAAHDLLNPEAAARLNRKGYVLAIQAGGNAAVIERYAREFGGTEALEGDGEAAFWRGVREFAPDFLRDHPQGAVVRISSALSELKTVIRELKAPVVARAGSGVCYACFADGDSVARSHAVVEWGTARQGSVSPPDYEIMKKVKNLFDPGNLLNRGRLYGLL
jgi:glycolate oxidase FAD binding subunit